MREIKFRVWDKEKEKMSHSLPVDVVFRWTPMENFYEIIFSEDFEQFIDTAAEGIEVNYILQQYTGLKDRMGREIYEGDILNFPEQSKVKHDSSKPNHPGWYGVVTYEIKSEHESKSGFIAKGLIFKWSACEVIGNMYENPKLYGKIILGE